MSLVRSPVPAAATDDGAGARGQVRPAARRSTSASRCAGLLVRRLRELCSSPGAILQLFTLIHEHRGEQRGGAAPRGRPVRVAGNGSPRTTDMQRARAFQLLALPGRARPTHDLRRVPAREGLRAPARARRARRPEAAGEAVLLELRRARGSRARLGVRLLPRGGLDARSRSGQDHDPPAPAGRGEAKDGGPRARVAASSWIGSAVDRLFRDRPATSIDLREVGLVEAGIAAIAGLFAALTRLAGCRKRPSASLAPEGRTLTYRNTRACGLRRSPRSGPF